MVNADGAASHLFSPRGDKDAEGKGGPQAVVRDEGRGQAHAFPQGSTDEFVSADYFNTHIEVDSRDVHPSNGSNTTVMRRLFQALTSANNAAARYSAS